jgi:DNA-binding response OmpR family regulator
MQDLQVPEPAVDLSGSRIGLLGFPAELSETLGGVLKSSQCLLTNLSTTCDDLSDPLECYDILIVWAGEDGPAARVAELMATPQRWLLFGPEERIRQNPILFLRADDVVFTPYSSNELLFRIHRAIHRVRIVSQHASKRSKPSVLAADDDPDMRTLLESVLRTSAWDCHFATSGRQALVMARKLLPDLLLLDIEMPLMTGLEVLRRIRRDTETHAIKVLMLTASSALKDVEESLSLGADDYLAKPFSPLALQDRVRQLLSSPSTI